MKRPRIAAFDPTAQDRPLKSPMDDFPAIQSPPARQQDERIRTTVPPVPLTGRRKIKQRHPFDIYADQLDTLKELSLDDRKQGGAGSMSAMVREALDDFIAKKRG